MKKNTTLFLIIVLSILYFASVSFAQPVSFSYDGILYQQDKFSLKINSDVMFSDMTILIVDNRTLVPARDVFEKLGAEVIWDGVNRIVHINADKVEITLKINDTKAIVNGKERHMDVPARIVNDKTMIPLRFVGEQMNMIVGWHSDEKLITLTSCKMTGISSSFVSSTEKVEISFLLDGCNTYNTFILKEPDRVVVDIPNTVLIGDPAQIPVNIHPVKSVRYAQFDKSTTRIVFDVIGQPQYSINTVEGRLVVSFSTTKLGDEVPAPTAIPSPTPMSTPEPAKPTPTVKPTPTTVATPTTTPVLTPTVMPVETQEPAKPTPTPMPTPTVAATPTTAPVPTTIPTPTPTPEQNEHILESVSTYEKSGNRILLTMTNIKLVDEDGNKKYEELRDSTGKTIILKFPDDAAIIENKTIELNDPLVDNIIIFKNTNTKEYFIVINTKRRILYNITYNSAVKSSLIEMYEPELVDRGDTSPKTPPANYNNLEGIDHSLNSGRDRISVKLPNFYGYNAFRLTDPDRIVVDIPNTRTESLQQVLNVNSNLIKGVRYAQYKENVVRVVIDLKSQAWYEITENTGELAIELVKPQFVGVKYHNVYDRVYLTLPGVKLTGGQEEKIKYYTDRYDPNGNSYMLTFATDSPIFGTGKMMINDGMLESIEISYDTARKETCVKFNANAGYVYNVSGRSETGDTAVTIINPYSLDDRLVIIDPGHGGVDPGAVAGNIYEKNFNLDTALRLQRLLEKKNINTYMMREDDTFVGLYERAYIANKLNGTLFLSIHNNAHPSNKNYGGTEAFYFQGGTTIGNINGQIFAGLVQQKLVQYLNTADRQIKHKNYVVIEATTMPAVLAEIAFMTNENDLRNLLDDDFRQRAAEALFDAIEEALNRI